MNALLTDAIMSPPSPRGRKEKKEKEISHARAYPAFSTGFFFTKALASWSAGD